MYPNLSPWSVIPNESSFGKIGHDEQGRLLETIIICKTCHIKCNVFITFYKVYATGMFIMKIRPLADRVVIKMVEAEEKTKSGIVLPGSAKEQPQMAEVVEVGPGGVVDGKEIKMELKVGDKVLFSKYAGTEVKLDGQEFTILRQSDILAVVE